jgi:hypothetical protein
MVSHPLFYQLVLCALLWLFGILHLARPTCVVTAPDAPADPAPLTPKRPRSHEPKAFEGLPPKPHCALCERDTASPKAPPPVPPAPLAPTNRRPREIDPSQHFCPQAGCDYRGWLGLGHLRAHGHPSGGLWRQFHWMSCKGYWLATHGTICPGKPASAYFLCALHVEPLQLAEVYAVLRDRKAGAINDDEALKRLERSPSWGWTAIAPTSKLLVGGDVGCRTLAMAQRVVYQVTGVLAPGCIPLFLTDGLKEYKTALLDHCGPWRHPERHQDKGPMPKPRWRPLPALLYAQVVKSYRRWRIVGGTHHVVCGTRLAIEQGRARCGWTITPAFVERLNLDIRQRVAAIGRRVKTLGQGEASLRAPLALFHVYHSCVLPHASLRQPRLIPEPTHGCGSAKVWRPCTPAMCMP